MDDHLVTVDSIEDPKDTVKKGGKFSFKKKFKLPHLGKNNKRLIFSAVALFVLTMGTATGTVLLQSEQDIRSMAGDSCTAGEPHCNTSQCKQYTCNATGDGWDGPQGTGVCAKHPDCQEGGDDEGTGGRCSGWAEPGSTHCNTSECKEYKCKDDGSGDWDGPKDTGVCASHPDCGGDGGDDGGGNNCSNNSPTATTCRGEAPGTRCLALDDGRTYSCQQSGNDASGILCGCVEDTNGNNGGGENCSPNAVACNPNLCQQFTCNAAGTSWGTAQGLGVCATHPDCGGGDDNTCPSNICWSSDKDNGAVRCEDNGTTKWCCPEGEHTIYNTCTSLPACPDAISSERCQSNYANNASKCVGLSGLERWCCDNPNYEIVDYECVQPSSSSVLPACPDYLSSSRCQLNRASNASKCAGLGERWCCDDSDHVIVDDKCVPSLNNSCDSGCEKWGGNVSDCGRGQCADNEMYKTRSCLGEYAGCSWAKCMSDSRCTTTTVNPDLELSKCPSNSIFPDCSDEAFGTYCSDAVNEGECQLVNEFNGCGCRNLKPITSVSQSITATADANNDQRVDNYELGGAIAELEAAPDQKVKVIARYNPTESTSQVAAATSNHPLDTNGDGYLDSVEFLTPILENWTGSI